LIVRKKKEAFLLLKIFFFEPSKFDQKKRKFSSLFAAFFAPKYFNFCHFFIAKKQSLLFIAAFKIA